MPCDSIVVLSNINFEQAKGHVDILLAAMQARGFTVSRSGQSISFYGHGYSGTYSNGRFRAQQGFEQHVDGIKQEFSKASIRYAAKKMGWPLKSLGATKMRLEKRR
jgi:hypothetical protein